MGSHYCHECQHEGDSFPSNAQGPVCPQCGGDFVEEIPDNDTATDDPRDFDPDDGPDPHLPFFLGAPQGGGPGILQFQLPGGGGAFFAAGGAPGAGSEDGAPPGLAGLNPLTLAMLRSFGMNEPGPGAVPESREGRSGDATGEEEEHRRGGPDAGAEGQQHAHRVPIRNLATFLGEAFGAATPHPADDPGNNPFAEGGHERDGHDVDENRQGTEGRAPGAPGAVHIGGGGGGLGFLGALLNAFGMTGGAAGGLIGTDGSFVLPANMGDYALGEGGFQQILNDLMEQAAGRAGPQPAPDDMIEKLPRIKITQDLLGLESMTTCAVCQDEWALDETAIALPCKPTSHLYHEACIVPWLKTSGTCPTCRFALVPQPGQPGYGEENPTNAVPGAGAGAAGASATSNEAFTRPGMPGRQSSLNPFSSATARIPEVHGGSSLPGSWLWNEGEPDEEGSGRGNGASDPDEMALDTAQEDARERDPISAAVQAAERRAREREEASSTVPIMEDVD